MSIKNNLNLIQEDIEELLKKLGREKDPFTLIAVSKTVDCDRIQEAVEWGITDIGENKVQELVRKKEEMGDIVKYHMIGALQSNKVKDVMDKAFLIHSLDRNSLLKEIEKRGRQREQVVDCLIEINLGEEESKAGIYLEELETFIEKIENCNYIRIKGIMTIAPFYEDPEDVRPIFRKMKEIFDDLKNRSLHNFDMEYLSMGMSHDFKIAIEEGSNMVRIGTSIFGERDYSKI